MNALRTVQTRLSKASDSPAARLALKWLNTHSARPVSAEPAKVTASEALRLWRVREKTTQTNPRGIPELVHQLEQLAGQRQVEQFGFSDEESTALFFFTKADGTYLGSVVVQTR